MSDQINSQQQYIYFTVYSRKFIASQQLSSTPLSLLFAGNGLVATMTKTTSTAMTIVNAAPVTKMKINEEVLKQFVGNLIVAHNLKLKGWISDVLQSDVLEHKIYEFAVRQAMEYCYYEVLST